MFSSDRGHTEGDETSRRKGSLTTSDGKKKKAEDKPEKKKKKDGQEKKKKPKASEEQESKSTEEKGDEGKNRFTRGSFRKKRDSPETPKANTNGKDGDDKKSKKAAKEAKNKEEKARKEKLKQEQKEQKKAEKVKRLKEKEEKKAGGEKKPAAGGEKKLSASSEKKRTIRISGKKPSKTAEMKKEMLTTNPLIGRSVPNLRKKKSPTFIKGFNMDPFSHDKGLSLIFDEKKKAELAARKRAAQVGPARGYAAALTDYEKPELKRTASFISRSFDTNTPKYQQLQSMKGNNFWFSTISFIREREEGKRKASVDSLESQLSLKWDDFMESLPKIEKPRQGKVRDGYDEEGVKNLEDQGAKIMSALLFKAETDRGSVASKFALKPGETAPTPAIKDEGLKESIDKVVLPSYLQGFTGEEPENVVPTDSGRLAKYAVCMLQHANPNIAVDAKYDMLFGECASEDPGVYIWRIEYFMPLEIPENEYPDPDAEEPQRGILYSEDCYIILHITAVNEAKKFTIFTWVGKKATRDKIGAAAIRSRELNILLKNKARMLREVEGEESDDFLELYDYDVQYIDSGGTETGFKPALPFVQEARMYRLHFTKEKLRKNLDSEDMIERSVFNMTQVRLSALSLTKSDVFILDGGTDGWLWVWNGSLASKKLRWKGHEIVTRIYRYEKGCRSLVITLEEGQERNVFTKIKEKKKIPDSEITEFFDPALNIEEEEDEVDERSFWDYMREREFAGDGGMLPTEGPPIACDIVFCKTAINPDTGKPMLITLKKAGEPILLSYKMLDPTAAFIMDADTCLFTWIGKKSSKLERQIAGALTKKFKANQKDRASWAPIIEIQQGSEPSCFITKFPDWCARLFAPLPSNFATAQHTRYLIAPPNPAPLITIDMLTEETPMPPEEFIDDATGTVEVWAIEDGKPTFTKLPPEERGHFYSGDCFLVLYTYYDVTNKMKQAYLCYFWEGRSSIASRWWPAFLFGFYPVLEKKIKTYGGNPPRKIRVAEHKEPPHFCRLFGGNIVIHKGHRKQPNIVTLKPKKEKKKALYHIRRTTDTITHTVQVRAQPKSLHSSDAFVLLTQAKAYLWYGSGTSFNDSNAILAALNALKGNREMEQLDEGEEVPAFWNILGGWTTYTCNQDFVQKYKLKPRLYSFSTGSGRLKVKEVLLYYQTDLKRTNVYILDTMYEVYAWAGKRASESLYKQVLDFANKYVREMALRRKRFVELISVAEGEEPLEFTRHFHTWVAKDPFLDPILAREEKYTDLLFQEYKKREQEEKRKKESKASQRHTEVPLLRLDWMEIVRREIPDLVVDSGDEYEEYTDEYVTDEDEVDEGENGDSYSSDEEITIANLKPEEEEVKVEPQNVADYYIDKINKASRNYKLYNK